MNKILKKILNPFNIVHYALLSIILSFVAYLFGAPLTFWMTVIVFITLFIADTLIHMFLGLFGWKD